MMIEFVTHPSFQKEAAKLTRRFLSLEKALESFKTLCEFQFHPLHPERRIAPAKLHRITQNDVWSLWKIELSVPQVKSNQSPRMWFAVRGSNIVFLCIASHIDNYDDNELTEVAVGRVTDFF